MFLILLVGGLTGCSAIDENEETPKSYFVSDGGDFLAVSLNAGGTMRVKMTSENTQRTGNFKGIEDMVVLPFTSTASGDPKKVSPIVAEDECMLNNLRLRPVDGDDEGEISSFSGSMTHTFNSSQSRLYPLVSKPYAARSFLVYGKGKRSGDTSADKFAQGSTLMTGVSTNDEILTQAGAITFLPDQIQPTEDWTNANAIITYLNNLIGTTYSARTTYHGARTQRQQQGGWYNPTYSYSYQTTSITTNVSLAWDSQEGSTSTNNTYYYKLAVPAGLKTVRTNFINSLNNVPCAPVVVQNALTTLVADLNNLNYNNDSSTGFTYNNASEASYNNTTDDNYNHSAADNFPIYQSLRNSIITAASNATLASSQLPDGISLIHWNTSTSQFELQKYDNANLSGTTIAEPEMFVYPAQLWYYSNSLIKTSDNKEMTENDWISLYSSASTWDDLLSNSVWTGARVESATTSTALVKPLNYGVSQLELKIKGGSNPLTDKDATHSFIVGTSSTIFPLTAVLVADQHKVGFNFVPSSALQYMIYDKTLAQNMYIRYNTEQGPNYTLTLPSGDDEKVRIILEFQNNSTQEMKGINDARIPVGSKFYLVGEVTPSGEISGYGDEDQFGTLIKNVFHSDYVTTVTATISSLKDAYNVVPDVSNPLLVLSLEMDLQWKQATPQNLSFE